MTAEGISEMNKKVKMEKYKELLNSFSVTDLQTLDAIREISDKYGYVR